MSLCTHALLAVAMLLIAHAFFQHVPTLREHMVLVPLGWLPEGCPSPPPALAL